MSADAAADAGEGSSKATLDLPARGDGAAGGAEGASPPRDASEIVPFEVEQKGEEVTLARTLSFWDGSAIVVGLIIGSGIFASSGDVVVNAGSAGAALLAWVASGLLVLGAGLVYAELGTMLQNTGGETEYLRCAFGDAASFSFTWTNFFVIKTASHAIISLVFARYVSVAFFGTEPSPEVDKGAGVKVTAVLCMLLFNFVNCLGVKLGAKVQGVFVVLKFVAVGFVMIAGVYQVVSKPSVLGANLHNPFEGTSTTGFGSAMISCLWAYDGFNNGNYVVEELKKPKQLPKIITMGMLTVTTIYMLVNIAYVAALTVDDLRTTPTVALTFVSKVMGPSATAVRSAMACAVALSAAGSVNASVLTGARVIFAAARDKRFPKVLGVLNQKFRTPVNALIAQSVWGTVLLALPFSDFHALVGYFGACSWVYYGATAAALVMLRRKQPELHRPYRVAFYPATPFLVMLIAAVLVLSSLWNDPLPTLAALCFIAVSFPVYWFVYRDADRRGGGFSGRGGRGGGGGGGGSHEFGQLEDSD